MPDVDRFREVNASPAKADRARALVAKRNAGIEARRQHTAEVFKTLAFLYDQQDIMIDSKTFRIVRVNRKKQRDNRDNRLRPMFEWLKAQFFKTLPVVTVHGMGEDVSDAMAAQVASKLARYWRAKSGWLRAEREAFNWVAVAGMAFIAPVWRRNPLARQTEEVWKFHDQPVQQYDPNTGQGETTYLSREKVAGFGGGLRFDVYTTMQTLTFPLTATTWDQVTEVMTVDLVTREYIERYLGREIDVADLTPAEPGELNLENIEQINARVGSGFGLLDEDDKREDRYILAVHRERPTFENPEGRMTIMIGRKIVDQRPLPYIAEAREVDPLDTQNLSMGVIPWRWYDHPGRLIPQSPIASLIPSQVHYNELLRDQARNRQVVGRNKTFYWEGTIDDDDITDEHGEMVKLKLGTERDQLPYFTQGAPLAGIENEIIMQEQRFDEASGRTQAARGQNPPQVRSAFHMDMLLEVSRLPLEDKIRMREAHAQDVFWLSAAMARNRMSEEELIQIYGPARMADALAFLQADFRTDMEVTEGSGIPVNKASQEAKIKELIQYGVFTDPTTGGVNTDMVLDMLKLGKLDPKVNARRLARQSAMNENYRLLRGEIVQIEDHENHDMHWEVHSWLVETEAFKAAPDRVQALVLHHLNETQRALSAAMSPEMALQSVQEDERDSARAAAGETSRLELADL